MRTLSRDLGLSFLFRYRYGHGRAPFAPVELENPKEVDNDEIMVASFRTINNRT